MSKWIVTGISGSGRIELLQEIAACASKEDGGKKVKVYDVGAAIGEECRRQKIPIVDQRILDVDPYLLQALRANAVKETQIRMLGNQDADLHLIGVHATFRWKGRIIPGISYADILAIEPDGFVNVVDNVDRVHEINKKNPKWDEDTLPDLKETQEWMLEEEFVTQVLADVVGKPMYLVGRNHTTANICDLFLTAKKKVYLSYPITMIEKEDPQLLGEIQGPILDRLENLFVMFNPGTVEEMKLIGSLPEEVDQLSPSAKQLITARTIERDFQFIDQSDAVVALYLTDKVSAGVLAEIYYAHRTQKPVFMAFPYRQSPFLQDATSHISEDVEGLMAELEKYAACD